PELTAGGLFAELARQPEAVGLSENRRQHEPWEVAALAELRVGDPTVALAAYRDHDRVHQADTMADARTQLVADWHRWYSVGERAIMVAVSNRDVDALNQLARDRLQADGTLGPDRIEASGRRFAVGDRVMTLHNDPRLNVFNGVIGTIDNIDTNARTVTIR